MTNLCSRRKCATRGIIWTLTVAFLLLSVVAVSQQASALPVFVQGKVRNQIGTPLMGANVTVEVWTDTVLQYTKYYDETDEDGSYSVSFGFPVDPYPLVGDTIKVIATHSSGSAYNSTVVVDVSPLPMPGVYFINVTIVDVTIPEFGIGQNIGLPLAIIGVMAVFVAMARKRKR